MIQIHRRQQLVHVNRRPVKLNRTEYDLLTILGMMDNRLAPYDLLLEAISRGRKRIDKDMQILWLNMFRLKKKIGGEYLRCQKWQGYILTGRVQFIGE